RSDNVPLSKAPNSNSDVGHDLRLVLVGLDRVGKSAAGNTIMGQEVFESGVSFTSLTLKSESRERELCGRKVKVVDTPGLLNIMNLKDHEVYTRCGISGTRFKINSEMYVLIVHRPNKLIQFSA
uniref:AIG1-type G domain-containing protein n=1 Tax=Hucho hucho TaxID=62062 RepID=A0A4W5RVG5_9TELE